MQQVRPNVTVRPAPAAPVPLWEAHHLFCEPDYADGQDYDTAAPGGEDDDLECPAA